MNLLRKHWYDLGGFFAIIVSAYLYFNFQQLSHYQMIVWISLLTLFLHQFEEYRAVGTFPGMINSVLFKSQAPDRYPLNSNSALIINVGIGWIPYFLAVLFSEKAVWLGIATILVSLGNTVAHTFLFNIKGKTLYNAGMFTGLLLFAPCVIVFFSIIQNENLAKLSDYFIGIPLGLALNIFGILKMIDWLKNINSPFIFPDRNLLPKYRKAN